MRDAEGGTLLYSGRGTVGGDPNVLRGPSTRSAPSLPTLKL